MHKRDDEGLILPKKIINPCLESKDVRALHRELIFNNKIGKSVLNQKTELQRALQKQKERISQHNRDENSSSTNQGLGLDKGVLDKEFMQEIAKRNMRNNEGNSSKADACDSEALNEEYLRIKSKLKHADSNADI